MSRAETERVLERLADALEAGERAALAVVVGVSGSAYRGTGAAMALGNGWSVGRVSAGCLEADVRLRADAALVKGRAGTVEYDTGDRSPFGLGIGCGGRIRVAVVPLEPADAPHVRSQANAARGEDPFDFVVKPGAEGPQGGGGLSFRCHYPVPDWVHVYGAGTDSDPLVEMAARAGFRVAVVDHRPGLLRRAGLREGRSRIQCAAGEKSGMPERAGRIFAVVKTHDLARDRAWLAALRGTAACYLGLMGPLARVDELIRDTGGVDPRIRAPVGLDLGGDGAWAVALSIVAELQAVAAGGSGRPLADVRRGDSSTSSGRSASLLPGEPGRGACLPSAAP